MSRHSAEDRIYRDGEAGPGSFRFDDRVARVFDDMIRRSVPGYSATLGMIGWLVTRYARPQTACYDLGCSLGSGLLACASALADAGGETDLIGVDTSDAMLARCRERMQEQCPAPLPELIRGDIRTLALRPSSVVLLNWTLQFVPLADREPLLRRIHAALLPGGALIISEKIVDPDPAAQSLAQQLHADFKRSQGYTELEIAAKRTALEDVLIPETLEAQTERLHRIGFRPVLTWNRQLCFASLLAIRP